MNNRAQVAREERAGDHDVDATGTADTDAPAVITNDHEVPSEPGTASTDDDAGDAAAVIVEHAVPEHVVEDAVDDVVEQVIEHDGASLVTAEELAVDADHLVVRLHREVVETPAPRQTFSPAQALHLAARGPVPARLGDGSAARHDRHDTRTWEGTTSS